MEGTAGLATWPQVLQGHEDYPRARELMTEEVLALCEGALDAGVEDIVVNDAHATMDNLLAERFPSQVRCLQGSPKRFGMMAGLERFGPFDAVAFTGYHAPSGYALGTMAHTVTRRVHAMDVNGLPVGEAWMNAAYAAVHGVPVLFVSGDDQACDAVASFQQGVHTVPVKWSVAEEAALGLAPEAARNAIREGIRVALDRAAAQPAAVLPLPDAAYTITIHFARAVHADLAETLPTSTRTGPYGVSFTHTSFPEVVRAYQTMTKLSLLATP